MVHPYRTQVIAAARSKQNLIAPGTENLNAYEKAIKRAGVDGTPTMPPIPEQGVPQFEIDRPANAPEYGSVRVPQDQD